MPSLSLSPPSVRVRMEVVAHTKHSLESLSKGSLSRPSSWGNMALGRSRQVRRGNGDHSCRAGGVISEMPTIKQQVSLNAHPRRVWDFITALRYLPVWMDGLASVQAISDPQAAAGTSFTALRRGSHTDESWLVADWEAPRRLRLIEYHRNLEFILELEPDRSGTRLSLRYTWPSRRGILDRLFAPKAEQQMVERTLARLQEAISLNRDIKLLQGMGDE